MSREMTSARLRGALSLLAVVSLFGIARPASALVYVGTQSPSGLRVLSDGGVQLASIPLPAVPVAIEATWSGDRVFVAHGAGGQIRSVNPLTGAIAGPVTVNDARHLVLSANGSQLYVASGVYGVVFVNTSNMTYSGQVHVGFPVDRVELSPNGATVYAIGATGIVKVDAINRWTTQAIGYSQRTVLATGLAPGGATLYVADAWGVQMFDTTTLAATSAGLADNQVTGIGFRWDGGVVYTSHAASNRLAANWNPPFFQPTTFVAAGAAPRALTVSKTGSPDSWVIAANTGSSSLTFAQTQSFASTKTVGLGAQPVCLDSTWAPSFISVNPGSLAFSYLGWAATSAKSVTVTNHSTGPVPLGIAKVISKAANFPILANTCNGQTLAAGASCTISVACAPGGSSTFSTTANYSSSLRIPTLPALQEVYVALSCSPVTLKLGRLSLK